MHFFVPDQLREEMGTTLYSDQWKMLREGWIKKKDAADAVNCSECNQLQDDGERNRCMMYDNATVHNKEEKHCKNSIR